jgi:putative sigma-54 modulation protein
VDLRVSADHKHDFVAVCHSMELTGAVDDVVEKMEQQLRKYKNKLQDRHRGPSHRQIETPEVPSSEDEATSDIPATPESGL